MTVVRFIKDLSLAAAAEADLPWLYRNIPLTRRVASELGDFARRPICLNIHLDIKMVPVVEALVAAGARVLVVGCNPQTTRDSVAALMAKRGAAVYAWEGMSENERHDSIRWALDEGCQFVSEMGGAVLSTEVSETPPRRGTLRAGMEATGTGIRQLQQLALPIPVFNWDDLALKQGLHNRYLVGLMVWHTFIHLTALTLYDRPVLVVGYGLVGQGIAEHARLLGARVMVCDHDPVQQLLARHHGCEAVTLPDGLRRAGVVVTATGREGVITESAFPLLPDGCILANAGHSSLEIEIAALRRYPGLHMRPGIQGYDVNGKTVYLLAGGAMLNLAAGPGDPFDAFDLTSALMIAGIEFMVRRYTEYPAGIHLLPAEVEHRIAALASPGPTLSSSGLRENSAPEGSAPTRRGSG